MGGSKQGQEAKEKRIVNRLPHYGRFEYARLGYFSLSTKDIKFISRDDSVTVGQETETPGYFFGQFIKGVWTAKRSDNLIELSYPYRAIPGKFPAGVYIDIRHAFRQIMLVFGMEVFIREGKMCAYGETLPTAPCFNNRICRGLLVTGVSKNGSFQEWKDHDLRTVHFSNPYYSPHVRYTIWAALHAVQTYLAPYSLYAHTDGVIVPARHEERIGRMLCEIGLNYTVKHRGAGEIYGVSNYRIGHHRSLTTNRDNHSRSNIREDNYKWWLDQIVKGVSLRNEVRQEQLFDAVKPVETLV